MAERYDPESNLGLAPDDPRLTDFRWRRLAVSPDQLNAMARGGVPTPHTRAPADLMVIGLFRVTTGGWWELIVWSAEFDPCPNDGKYRLDELSLVEFGGLL